MTLYFDLDGVLRDLGPMVIGHDPISWNEKVNNKDFFQLVEEDKTVLYKAPPTQYLSVILALCDEINILSSQLSGNWCEFTDIWIDNHVRRYKSVNVEYVSKPAEKIAFLKNDDILIEDFPFFADYSKIVVVDHPYNRILSRAEKQPITRISNTDEMKDFLLSTPLTQKTQSGIIRSI